MTRRLRWALPLCLITATGTAIYAGPDLAPPLRDPMDVLSERSPGARPAGALMDTKGGHEPYLDLTCVKCGGDTGPLDVQPNTLDDGVDDGAPTIAHANLALPDALVLPDVGSEPLHNLQGLPGGGPAYGGTGGHGGGGSGSGGTIPSGPTLPTTPTEPATPAPEPSTWVLMVLGMAAIGAVLRRGGAHVGS